MGRKQEDVLVTIWKLGSGTDRMIASELHCGDPNQVRPRRKELYDMGIVYDNGVDICKVSGRKAIYWAIKDKIVLKKKRREKCQFCNGKGYYEKIEDDKKRDGAVPKKE